MSKCQRQFVVTGGLCPNLGLFLIFLPFPKKTATSGSRQMTPEATSRLRGTEGGEQMMTGTLSGGPAMRARGSL